MHISYIPGLFLCIFHIFQVQFYAYFIHFRLNSMHISYIPGSILCIFHIFQVQTGFGRTGTHFWGFQGHDISPDIGMARVINFIIKYSCFVLQLHPRLNPCPNKPWFLCVSSTSLLKTL